MPKELPISATLSEATRLFSELGVSAKGTGPRAGGDNRDPLFHEYMVAKHLESVAKKRAEACLERIRDVIAQSVPADVDKFIEPSEPGMHTIDGTARYTFLCEVKRGAERVDHKVLVAELAKAGVKASVLDAAVAAATKQNNPSRSYRVIANG